MFTRSVYADVRDVATAHVLAATTPEAGGERIIISHSPFKWQDFGEHNTRVRFSYGGS